MSLSNTRGAAEPRWRLKIESTQITGSEIRVGKVEFQPESRVHRSNPKGHHVTTRRAIAMIPGLSTRRTGGDKGDGEDCGEAGGEIGGGLLVIIIDGPRLPLIKELVNRGPLSAAGEVPKRGRSLSNTEKSAVSVEEGARLAIIIGVDIQPAGGSYYESSQMDRAGGGQWRQPWMVDVTTALAAATPATVGVAPGRREDVYGLEMGLGVEDGKGESSGRYLEDGRGREEKVIDAIRCSPMVGLGSGQVDALEIIEVEAILYTLPLGAAERVHDGCGKRWKHDYGRDLW
ncbi:hypothetical protein CPB86DRAFT_829028 [Serendipita vermifera]|nr:hypothetical protein CPB86DRAFT_829028 [Serendipita vermifera]